jgi:hypothetical protein
MVIRLLHSFVLCFLLSSLIPGAQPVHSKDFDGWSKAKWGMSDEEIQAAFAPDVKRLPKRIKYDERSFDLVLNDFKAGQINFTVRFLMDEQSDRLAGVSLKSEDSTLSADLFWALEKDLIQNYGLPSHRSKGVRLLTGWKFPSSSIEMLYVESPLAGRLIYLNYNSTAAMPASKP